MELILNEQTELRKIGRHDRLGKMLIERGLCTKDELINYVGYTAEAYDILLRIGKTEHKKTAIMGLKDKWVAGAESLFDMAVGSSIVTREEILNANSF